MRAKVDSLKRATTRQAPEKAIDFANNKRIANESDGAQKVSEPKTVSTQTNGSLGPK